MIDLDELVAPPARPGFREEVFRQGDAQRRVAVRRRRVGVLALLAVGAIAASAAGVRALVAGATITRYDRTMSCPIAIQGGVPVATLQATATRTFRSNGTLHTQLGFTGILDTNGQGFGGLGAARHGYGFPTPELCRAAKPVPLTRSGLPLVGVFTGKDEGLTSSLGINGAQCLVGAHVTVRIHAAIGRNDTPTSGQLALWTGAKKLRPVAFVDWTPTKVKVFASSDCHT